MRFTRWEALLQGLGKPLLFYDTECTSPNPKHARVVEFGVVAYGPSSLFEDGWEPDEQTREALARSLVPGLLFAARWRVAPLPLKTLDRGAFKRASRVHGIKLGDLVSQLDEVPREGVLTPAALRKVAEGMLTEGVVCGFNSAEYDDVVLHGEERSRPNALNSLRTRIDVLRVYRGVTGRASQPEAVFPLSDRLQSDDGFDALELARTAPAAVLDGTTELHRDTLSACSRVVLGARHEGAHGALADSMRSAEVLAGLMELWPRTCPGTLDGLELLTARPGYPWCGWDRMLKLELGEWVFQKGEHRGLALAQVDAGYLSWMCGRGRGKKPDFDASTVHEIERHIFGGLGPSPHYLSAEDQRETVDLPQ